MTNETEGVVTPQWTSTQKTIMVILLGLLLFLVALKLFPHFGLIVLIAAAFYIAYAALSIVIPLIRALYF